MYKRILVPVDGSTTSTLGLNEAIGLAAEQGAQLRILNVVDELILVPTVDTFPMAGIDEMIESLRAFGCKALDHAAMVATKKGVKAECVQLESRARPVSDVILSDAVKSRADLIVMGTHGRRGVNRLLVGSDAERVLREAPVPVLLVRGDKAKRKAPEGLQNKTVSTRSRAKGGAKRRQTA
ncbi:MAG: universal stress protein [Burkholderiales bacterium]